MLPDVNADDGDQGRLDGGQRVLVLGLAGKTQAFGQFQWPWARLMQRHALDGESAVGLVSTEPTPAGALDGSGGSVELLLEFIEAAELSVDGLGQSAAGLELGSVRAGGGKVLPAVRAFQSEHCP